MNRAKFISRCVVASIYMLVTAIQNDTEGGMFLLALLSQGLKMGCALAVAGRSLGCDQPEQDGAGEVWLQALIGMARCVQNSRA